MTETLLTVERSQYSRKMLKHEGLGDLASQSAPAGYESIRNRGSLKISAALKNPQNANGVARRRT